jgi:hypothetical protein
VAADRPEASVAPSSAELLGTVGTVAMAGLGCVYGFAASHRAKLHENEMVRQELEVLEGEGGICLS